MAGYRAPEVIALRASPNASDAAVQLLGLQVEQFHHDEMFHREIARLTLHHRINHMALHLAKYVGLIARALDGDEPSRSIDRAIVDAFIIGVSSANILNLRISDHLIGESHYPNLGALGADLARTAGVSQFDGGWLLKTMAIVVGRMAKACESADHLEAYPIREELSSSVAELMRVLVMAMSLRKIDPCSVVRERLKGVKEKSIFHGLL